MMVMARLKILNPGTYISSTAAAQPLSYCRLHNSVKLQIFLKMSRDPGNNGPAKAEATERAGSDQSRMEGNLIKSHCESEYIVITMIEGLLWGM